LNPLRYKINNSQLIKITIWGVYIMKLAFADGGSAVGEPKELTPMLKRQVILTIH
jgi:hypothetical protein